MHCIGNVSLAKATSISPNIARARARPYFLLAQNCENCARIEAPRAFLYIYLYKYINCRRFMDGSLEVDRAKKKLETQLNG